jgi:hypothetical protein
MQSLSVCCKASAKVWGYISQLITLSWPLQCWGMDIVGLLPTAQGNFKFAVVAVEYFTKVD